MNKGSGVGVGSASIILVFAVLCLSVFSLITFVVARNNEALVDAETRLVKGYYEADMLAERILSVIFEGESVPGTALGVDIEAYRDPERDEDVIQFLCPIPDSGKSLFVRLSIRGDSYEILSWRMRDTGEWIADDGRDVWLG